MVVCFASLMLQYQVWFDKLSRLTEVAHDLVPSHIADVLVRNQEAAHHQQQQQQQRSDAAAPLLMSDKSSPKAPWQETSEGQKKLESPSITGIGAPPMPGRWNASLNLTLQKSSLSRASAVASPQGPRSTDSFHPGHTCSRSILGADEEQHESLDAVIEPTRSSGNGISGILRRSLDVGGYMLRKPLSYNGGPSSAVGPSSQAALAVDSVQSPARSPVGGAQGNDAVAAFSHDCVTILFAGQDGCVLMVAMCYKKLYNSFSFRESSSSSSPYHFQCRRYCEVYRLV